jgi:hypothetical protein
VIGLDDKVFDAAKTGDDHIGVAYLVIDVGDGPIEDGGKQIFEDIFGDALGDCAKAVLLLEPVSTFLQEGRPGGVDASYTVAVRCKFFDH